MLMERNAELAVALRQNKRKARNQMRCNGGRCCLQVAEDVAIAGGLDIERSLATDEYPADSVYTYFGWDSAYIRVQVKNIDGTLSYLEYNFADLNDTVTWRGVEKGLPHRVIAEVIENNYVHPEKQNWSFSLIDDD